MSAVRGSVSAALVLLFAFAGCRRDGRPEADVHEATQNEARASGRVVAVVNGRPIHVQDVAEAARARGLAPREALRALEAEALLLGEAERRGYGSAPDTRRTVARAAVQALLAREVETSATTPEQRFAHLRKLLAELERHDRPFRNEPAISRAMSAPSEAQ